MSRIGKVPVAIPSGVTAAIDNGQLSVKGPKGALTLGLSELVSYTGFAIVLFSGAAVASLFVLRRRQNEERPFRAWGYPWAPGLFVLISGAMLVSEIARNPQTAMAGVAVIAAGAPIYWFVTRFRKVSVRPNI